MEKSALNHIKLGHFPVALALLLAAVTLAACGGGGGNNNAPAPPTPAGSASGTLVPPPTGGGNSIVVIVDTGPPTAPGQINMPYVSVTLCTPGAAPTAAACQTIDHVQLDTGSYGLRLLYSAIDSSLILPPAMNGAATIGECAAFSVGTIWGSVRYADIYLGGEVARSVPIQDIGDSPGGYPSVPTSCSSTGTMQSTQAQLGANGILGVGLFKNDCDACIVASPPIPGAYYACTSSGCAASDVTQGQVVQNPVADFAQDNNGVLVSLASFGTSGSTYSNVSGTLFFGIGTQSDNQLGGATIYAADPSGEIRTGFNGATIPAFFDTGSNALYFNDGSNIQMCTVNTWAYCPSPSPMQLAATISGANNLPSPGTAVSFSIVGADTLNAGVVAANIAGVWPGTPAQFDWGLPFFFGRPVYVAISGALVATSGVPATGPFFSY